MTQTRQALGDINQNCDDVSNSRMIGALPYGSDQLIDTRMARSGAAVTKLTLGPLMVHPAS